MRLAHLMVVMLLVPGVALAAGPLTGGLHLEPIDGINTFPSGAHLSENPHASPVGGCGLPGGASDQWYESAAYHFFVASGSYSDTPLPSGGCMDVREVWASWDASYMYIGVQGPNELYERGDLFIAIDTDNATGGGVEGVSPWVKAVDFCGWDPEFFVAIEAPATSGFGYAALLNKSHVTLQDTFSGLSFADGGYNSCDNGGMYYEVRLPLALMGLQGASPRVINLAVYTTYEDSDFDAYDSGPGCGQPSAWEQIGDYPYDADHCGGDHDCVTSLNDGSCGFPDSDDNNGPGNALNGRYPSSDNSGFEVDTIGEYYSITNFFETPPVPVENTTWGRIKNLGP